MKRTTQEELKERSINILTMAQDGLERGEICERLGITTGQFGSCNKVEGHNQKYNNIKIIKDAEDMEKIRLHFKNGNNIKTVSSNTGVDKHRILRLRTIYPSFYNEYENMKIESVSHLRVKKICDTCDMEYMSKRGGVRFCSDECKENYDASEADRYIIRVIYQLHPAERFLEGFLLIDRARKNNNKVGIYDVFIHLINCMPLFSICDHMSSGDQLDITARRLYKLYDQLVSGERFLVKACGKYILPPRKFKKEDFRQKKVYTYIEYLRNEYGYKTIIEPELV